jgi:hypothetical protein
MPACPVPTLQGSLLLSASSATLMDGRQRLHSKLDNPRWFCNSRNYGVGSSVALTQLNLIHQVPNTALQSYTYQEACYTPTVHCIKNSTSTIASSLIGQVPTGNNIAIYLLTGSLPNEAPCTKELYPVTNLNTNYQSILAWAARALNEENIVAIASGVGNYTELNQTQCETTFVPPPLRYLSTSPRKLWRCSRLRLIQPTSSHQVI